MSVLLNIILAVVALIFFFKFIRLKKLSETEFENYEEKLEEEVSKRKETELKYKSEAHYLAGSLPKAADKKEEVTAVAANGGQYSDIIKSLQQELEAMRKEKEQELVLRLEAEKQIELTLQKVHDAEKRIDDWRDLYAANLGSIIKAIEESSDELYQKLTKILDDKLKFQESAAAPSDSHGSEAIVKLEEALKSAGLISGSNYFMNYTIPADSRKSVPCDAFVVFSQENCAIIDIKGIKFLSEYIAAKAKGSKTAQEVLKNKMDRYFSYLSNPKYRSNVVNYFAMRKLVSPKANSSLVMLLGSEEEVDEIKNLGGNYLQILQKSQIHLHSFNTIVDLIGGS